MPIQQQLWQANDNNSEPVQLNVLSSLGIVLVLLEQLLNPAVFPILLGTTSSPPSHCLPTAIEFKLDYENHTYSQHYETCSVFRVWKHRKFQELGRDYFKTNDHVRFHFIQSL
jgi:hypothetical protein